MTRLEPITPLASVRLAPNPGPMTLDGTNSYVLRAGSGPAVVVDPGPADEGHLAALAGDGPIGLILITHQHLDHTEGAAGLHERTGAPVRAPSPADCLSGPPLSDGELIEVGDLRISVLATPGHTADSVCFHLPDDATHGSVLTGDTVLGRGTTVIGIPDGTLAQYLDSLRTLIALGRGVPRGDTGGPGRDGIPPGISQDASQELSQRALIGLPAHGATISDLPAMCEKYMRHRLERLEQVRAAVADLGVTPDADADETVAAVLAAVYGDVDPGVAFAAAYSVATQLAYLAAERA